MNIMYEPEAGATDQEKDTIFVLDVNGRLVEMEVPDDVEHD